jgi:predicted nucleotidyltransferase
MVARLAHNQEIGRSIRRPATIFSKEVGPLNSEVEEPAAGVDATHPTGRWSRGEAESTLLLKVLVGSRAHGLAAATADYDYRGVFVVPTSEHLRIGGKVKETAWIEGAAHLQQAGSVLDDTAWELGHFLKMAVQCNPTSLEVFAAPIEQATPEGLELRALFPALWDSRKVVDAFVNYGLNQRKKLLDDKDQRWEKYAVTWLRVLCQAERLLTHGVLMVDCTRHEEFQTLQLFRNKMASRGDVVNKCLSWEARVRQAATSTTAQRQRQDLDAVNAYLLGVRRARWE